MPPPFSPTPTPPPFPPPKPIPFGFPRAVMKKAAPVIIIGTVIHKMITEPGKAQEVVKGPDPETVKAIKLATQFGAQTPGALPKNPPIPSQEFFTGANADQPPQNPPLPESRIYSTAPPYGQNRSIVDNFVGRAFGPRGSVLAPLYKFTPPPEKGKQLFFAPVPRTN